MSKTEELFEGGLHVFDDFLGKNIGIREVVGFFEAFVCELEDVEVALSRLMSFQVVGAKQVTKRPLFYSPRRLGFVLSNPIIDVLIPLREVRTRKLVKKYSVHRMLGIFQPAYHVRVN